MLKQKKENFTAVVWKEGRSYVSQCLNIDVASFGKTKKDALVKLAEALELYFEDRPRKIPEVKSPSLEVRELQHA